MKSPKLEIAHFDFEIVEATINSMDQGICVYDANWMLVMWNDRYVELAEQPRDKISAGKTVLEMIRNLAERGAFGEGDIDQICKERFQKYFLSGKATVEERTTSDGRVIDIRRNPIPGGGTVSTFTDITDRKRAERELAEARIRAEQADKAKSHFLAGMSHDLRTPLNAVIGFAGMINEQTFGPIGNDKYAEYTRIIEGTSKQLLSLVNDILDFSKMEATGYILQSESFDPLALSQEIVKTFAFMAQERDITLTARATPEAAKTLIGDTRVSTQIQNNMLANAFKYAPDKSAITLTWDRTEDGDVTLTVADEGPGFSDYVLENWGQPYLTEDGLRVNDTAVQGLGLFLCKRYIEARDGEMILKNRAGGGASITARWPAKNVDADIVGRKTHK